MTKKTLEERFWEKVDKRGPKDCWLWTAFKDPDGYGKLQMKHPLTGKCNRCARASRVCWELINGNVPDGLVVMHICDTPACVNPDHLKLGSIAENNRDRAFKKRSRNQNGILNNMAKLDDEGVSVVKYLYKNTKLSHSQIAEIFKVSRPTISLILEGKHWKHHDK